MCVCVTLDSENGLDEKMTFIIDDLFQRLLPLCNFLVALIIKLISRSESNFLETMQFLRNGAIFQNCAALLGTTVDWPQDLTQCVEHT